MVLAWALTLPAAAIVGALAAEVSTLGTWGTVLVGLAGVVVALGIYLASKRNPVNADSVNASESAVPQPANA
jgi:PiT family inorganic phosphate transporter